MRKCIVIIKYFEPLYFVHGFNSRGKMRRNTETQAKCRTLFTRMRVRGSSNNKMRRRWEGFRGQCNCQINAFTGYQWVIHCIEFISHVNAFIWQLHCPRKPSHRRRILLLLDPRTRMRVNKVLHFAWVSGVSTHFPRELNPWTKYRGSKYFMMTMHLRILDCIFRLHDFIVAHYTGKIRTPSLSWLLCECSLRRGDTEHNAVAVAFNLHRVKLFRILSQRENLVRMKLTLTILYRKVMNFGSIRSSDIVTL